MTTKAIDVIPSTYNLKTLAEFYGVCTKTMAKNIKLIAHLLGDRTGRRLYFTGEVEIIFQKYGTPKIKVVENDFKK